MHAARLDSSPRLQRVHELLSDGAAHSTLEIVTSAQVCAVNSIVAELRHAGAEIECRQSVSGSGQRVWLYRMTKPAAASRSWREDELPCESCGCTETAACEDPRLGPCWWTERDDGRRICSSCDERESEGSGSSEATGRELRQLRLFA